MNVIVRQPDPRHRRDQRVDLPGAPRVRATTRPTRGGPGQWRGCPGSRVREAACSRPSTIYTYMVGMKYPMPGIAGGSDGSPNELVTNCETEHAPRRSRAWPTRVPHAAGEAFRVPLRRRRRLGRSARARSRAGARRRARRVRLASKRARRDYGVVLTGSLDDDTLARRRTTRHASALRASRASGGVASDGLPHRHRRRRHVHRLHPRARRRRHRAAQGADHARRPEPRRDERASRCSRRATASTRARSSRAPTSIVHGTTTADNTMIEMNGAKTGLITTQGHRDEIEIRRGYKERHLGSGAAAAGADRAAAPPLRHPRAARLPRRGGDAARRGRRARGGAAAAPPGHRVDRGVLPVLVPEPGARAARARDRRARSIPTRASRSRTR